MKKILCILCVTLLVSAVNASDSIPKLTENPVKTQKVLTVYQTGGLSLYLGGKSPFLYRSFLGIRGVLQTKVGFVGMLGGELAIRGVRPQFPWTDTELHAAGMAGWRFKVGKRTHLTAGPALSLHGIALADPKFIFKETDTERRDIYYRAVFGFGLVEHEYDNGRLLFEANVRINTGKNAIESVTSDFTPTTELRGKFAGNWRMVSWNADLRVPSIKGEKMPDMFLGRIELGLTVLSNKDRSARLQVFTSKSWETSSKGDRFSSWNLGVRYTGGSGI